MHLLIDKAVLQNPRVNPASENYPVQYQVTVVAGRGQFVLSSPVPLGDLPLIEPVKIDATVERFSGGKGFFVVNVSAVSISPLVRSK